MRVSFTIIDSGLKIRTARCIREILPAIRAAEQKSGEAMKARCKELSRHFGNLSSAELRALGYPYSRRNPHPPMDPGIINFQTGLFYNSWHYRTDTVGGDTSRLFIYNDAPYAKYMPGTRKMINRPILEKMFRTEGPARFRRLQAQFGDVLHR